MAMLITAICAGHVERTNDRDYEIEERYVRCCLFIFEQKRLGILMVDRRFRTMEAASTRLQKEAKGYLDSLRGVLLLASLSGIMWMWRLAGC